MDITLITSYLRKVFATTADLTAHEAATDPHAGYQKESEKGIASGYASLDGSALVPVAQIPAIAESGVTNLVTDLAGKSSIAAITDLAASFNVPTTGTYNVLNRIGLSSTRRMTLAGTGRGTIYDVVPVQTETKIQTSFLIASDVNLNQFKRLSLMGNTRATFLGTSEMVLTEYKPGGRLVLAGQGGGS